MTAVTQYRKKGWRSAILGAAAVVVVLLLLVVGWQLVVGSEMFSGTEAPGTFGGELTEQAMRGDLLISFWERGTVKAARSVPIYCQVEGQSTIVSVVPEGTYVKEGQLLVELDSSSLEQQLNQQQISVDSSRASWKQAEEQLKIQESLNQSNIEAARLDVELADIDLRRYLEGDYPQAKMKANNDILLAREELTRAKDKYEWTKKLAEKGYVTRMDEQADRLKVMQSEVQYDQANSALKVLENYTHEKDLKTYQSNLEQNRAALERVRSKAIAELEQAKADVQGKESTHRLSENRLRKLQDQLKKTRILAPQDGMVVFQAPSFRRGRETVVEQGAEVRENQQLLELPDVSVMAVTVQVHESWIDQVQVGLPALISIDALPNLNLRGHITKIGLLPDQVNRWLNPDLKVYKTEVTVDDGQDTALLRPGMSAKVQIIITKLENVVYVPVQSVTTIDKQQVCYVLEGGEFRPRKVQGGLYNESYLQIVKGLEEGETIQLNAPSPQGGTDWAELEDMAGEFELTDRQSVPEFGGEQRRSRAFGGPFPGNGAEVTAGAIQPQGSPKLRLGGPRRSERSGGMARGEEGDQRLRGRRPPREGRRGRPGEVEGAGPPREGRRGRPGEVEGAGPPREGRRGRPGEVEGGARRTSQINREEATPQRSE